MAHSSIFHTLPGIVGKGAVERGEFFKAERKKKKKKQGKEIKNESYKHKSKCDE
jgi:hypothetical protein